MDKAAVVSVDVTSGEAEEKVGESDDEKEWDEKEWKKRGWKKYEKEDKKSKSNGVKLSKEMPAISSWTGTSSDGFVSGVEDFDDWLNSLPF